MTYCRPLELYFVGFTCINLILCSKFQSFWPIQNDNDSPETSTISEGCLYRVHLLPSRVESRWVAFKCFALGFEVLLVDVPCVTVCVHACIGDTMNIVCVFLAPFVFRMSAKCDNAHMRPTNCTCSLQTTFFGYCYVIAFVVYMYGCPNCMGRRPLAMRVTFETIHGQTYYSALVVDNSFSAFHGGRVKSPIESFFNRTFWRPKTHV